MKLPRYLPSSNPPKDEYTKDLDRSLDKQFAAILEILNTGIKFEDNFDGFETTVTTDATPGAETAITHGLKRVPTGFLILERDKPGHIFTGPTAKTDETYYIQSDVASVKTTILIF